MTIILLPMDTTIVTSIFSQNDFFIPLDSLLSPASDGVNIMINFLLIKKLYKKRNYYFVESFLIRSYFLIFFVVLRV